MIQNYKLKFEIKTTTLFGITFKLQSFLWGKTTFGIPPFFSHPDRAAPVI